MTDDNDKGRGTSTSGGRAPLTLKPRTSGAVSAGMVKQSFSHGRTKTVVVETKRRRVDAPGGRSPTLAPERRPAFEARPPAPPARPAARAADAGAAHGLSEDERRARQRAIELARQQQERLAAEREARARAEQPPATVAPPAPPMAAPAAMAAPETAPAPPAPASPPPVAAAPPAPPCTAADRPARRRPPPP